MVAGGQGGDAVFAACSRGQNLAAVLFINTFFPNFYSSAA